MVKKSEETPVINMNQSDFNDRAKKATEEMNEIQKKHDVAITYELVYEKQSITAKILLVDTKTNA